MKWTKATREEGEMSSRGNSKVSTGPNKAHVLEMCSSDPISFPLRGFSNLRFENLQVAVFGKW